jgi:hypothetical protein
MQSQNYVINALLNRFLLPPKILAVRLKNAVRLLLHIITRT